MLTGDNDTAARRIGQQLGSARCSRRCCRATRPPRSSSCSKRFHLVISGAAGGALWVADRPDLPYAPAGLVIGAAAGALGGAITDVGVNDNFMKEFGQKLTPGTSALILLLRKSTPDKLLPRIEHHVGHVIQTSLSGEEEQRLRAAPGE